MVKNLFEGIFGCPQIFKIIDKIGLTSELQSANICKLLVAAKKFSTGERKMLRNRKKVLDIVVSL